MDSEEAEALTPNHFLLGSSNGVKQPGVTIGNSARVQRDTYAQIQSQLDIFWQRWTREYLPVIRKQSKWFKETRVLREGDLVMLVEEHVRNGWVRGRVENVIYDKEGRVRQALVKTSSGVLRRPVSRLAVLDVDRDSSAVSETVEMHQGEDVVASVEPATLAK